MPCTAENSARASSWRWRGGISGSMALKGLSMLAKMASSLDRISHGRCALNIVNGWWMEEFELFSNGTWIGDAERYPRMGEYIQVIKGLWTDPDFNFDGSYYRAHVQAALTGAAGKVVMPDPGDIVAKASHLPYPPIYAASRSPQGKVLIAQGTIASGIAGLFAARRARIETVSYLPLVDEAPANASRSGKLKWLVKRRLYRMPNAYVTLNDHLCGKLKTLAPNARAMVLENYVDDRFSRSTLTKEAARATLGLPDDGTTIIAHVGRLNFQQKRQDFLMLNRVKYPV